MKKRIAQVITRLDRGGAPDILRILTRRASDRYDVDIITGPSRELSVKMDEFCRDYRDKIRVVPWLRRDINLLHDNAAFWQLYELFRRGKYDVVHTHTAKAGMLGRVAARLAGVKKIVHMPHGHNFYGYFNPIFSGMIVTAERLAAFCTDTILVLTELEKRDYLKHGIKDFDSIVTVPSGLEIMDFYRIHVKDKTEWKQALNIPLDKKIVGIASRLEPVKGVRDFISAACAACRKTNDVEFLVIGDGEQRQELEEMVKAAGVGERVRFLGWREDVLELISVCDILVQPSLNEAVGRSLLEAQILGVPVIATKVGGIPEVVLNGVTGVLMHPNEPDTLEEVIMCLLHDDEKRNALARQARKWVEEKFSAERMCEKIFRVYES
jgi:glycosyltransferase involved in cell wall biosynthesis